MQRLQRHLSWFLEPAQNPRRYEVWRAVLETSPGLAAVRHGTAPITYAIANDLDVLVDALHPTLEGVNRHFFDGSTYHLVAASVNNVKVARHLLSSGAGVDVPDRRRRLTPLHVAAEHEREEMVALLLEHGVSPFTRGDTDTTPFYRAARNGSTETLTFLYEAGSEVDAMTWDMWTPLMEAVENEHEGTVELSLSQGANPRNASSSGIAPLYLASEHLAPLIVEAGASRGTNRQGLLQELGS